MRPFWITTIYSQVQSVTGNGTSHVEWQVMVYWRCKNYAYGWNDIRATDDFTNGLWAYNRIILKIPYVVILFVIVQSGQYLHMPQQLSCQQIITWSVHYFSSRTLTRFGLLSHKLFVIWAPVHKRRETLMSEIDLINEVCICGRVWRYIYYSSQLSCDSWYNDS